MPTCFICPKRVFILRLLIRLLLKLFSAENDRLHARLVQTVSFSEVKDIKLDLCSPLTLVDNFEVEPLGVSFSVEVVFEPQVVFYVVHFRCLAQITRFKSTVKDKHVVKRWN